VADFRREIPAQCTPENGAPHCRDPMTRSAQQCIALPKTRIHTVKIVDTALYEIALFNWAIIDI
jgi:hypothetical protein